MTTAKHGAYIPIFTTNSIKINRILGITVSVLWLISCSKDQFNGQAVSISPDEVKSSNCRDYIVGASYEIISIYDKHGRLPTEVEAREILLKLKQTDMIETSDTITYQQTSTGTFLLVCPRPGSIASDMESTMPSKLLVEGVPVSNGTALAVPNIYIALILQDL